MGKLSKSSAPKTPPLTDAQTNMAEAPITAPVPEVKPAPQRVQRSIRLYQDMWGELEDVAGKLGGLSVNATVAIACKRLIDQENK